MSILLTGGAGFIGSHTAVELTNNGFDIVIADNFSNAEHSVIDRLAQITGKRPKVYDIDVCEKAAVRHMFEAEHAAGTPISAAVHFAGYKAVGESVAQPLMYYRNNLDSTITVVEVMKAFDVQIIVFSSSATVYGLTGEKEYVEGMPTGGMNPYGWTKAMIEQILMDEAASDDSADTFTPILLRYFNPVGAHESGLIGENPKGIPNNLMPFIQQVAIGKREKLSIFGNDYETKDGTGVRDYIHVVDLAKGHVKALQYAMEHPGLEIFNLGAGKGYSVLEVVQTFEKAAGVPVPYAFAPRRDGDLPEYYANAEKARKVLGWTAEKTLEDMCRDAWRWQQNCGG